MRTRALIANPENQSLAEAPKAMRSIFQLPWKSRTSMIICSRSPISAWHARTGPKYNKKSGCALLLILRSAVQANTLSGVFGEAPTVALALLEKWGWRKNIGDRAHFSYLTNWQNRIIRMAVRVSISTLRALTVLQI